MMMSLQISFFLFLVSKMSSGESGGVLTLRNLCYNNPGHLNVDGRVCDSFEYKSCNPYFRVCVSTNPVRGKLMKESCPIYFKKSKDFYHKTPICNGVFENEDGNLDVVEVPLKYPLQDAYFLSIYVKDGNKKSGNRRYIGSFTYAIRHVPYPYSSHFINASLVRVDQTYQNPNLSLTIELSVKCTQNPYTNQCSNFCQYKPKYNFICNEFGRKICKTGTQCFRTKEEKSNFSSEIIQYGIPVGICVALVIFALVGFCIIKKVLKKGSSVKINRMNDFKDNFENVEKFKTSNLEKCDGGGNVYEDIGFNVFQEELSSKPCTDNSHYVDMSSTKGISKNKNTRDVPLPSVPK